MPITTRTDPDHGVRVHEARGSLTFDELYAVLKKMYEDPGFDPHQDALWDLREAVLTEFSAEDVRRVAALVRDNWADRSSARAAMVVSRKADFGMVRMYELQLAPPTEDRTRVFTDLAEAWDWLTDPQGSQ